VERSDLTPEQLFTEFQRTRDRAIIAILHDRFDAKMLRTALSKAPPELAEDAVQHAWKQAIAKAEQWKDRGDGSFEGWLKAIVRNSCNDLRGKQEKPFDSMPEEEQEAVHDWQAHPFPPTQWQAPDPALRKLIGKVFHQLTEPERRLLHLVADRAPTDEVAKEFQITKDQVKGRVYALRRRVALLLEQLGYDKVSP
jgi:RNA polymerase sigma factor (sigma-70 family)